MALGGVHFGDFDGNAVSEADDAAGAAADEVIASGLKHEEIVCDAGQWNRTAHTKGRDIDEKAEVPNIRDKSWVCGSGAGC